MICLQITESIRKCSLKNISGVEDDEDEKFGIAQNPAGLPPTG